jgi:nucleoside-diphosphate-sugar epimerase
MSKVIACDFLTDNEKACWLPRLINIDVVINCVGVLVSKRKQDIWKIHFDTPRALFDACAVSGIKKIIQISALGITEGTVEFALSKKAADDYLANLNITAVILRPSLVYGPGSYGGTSLFRGIAGLPGFIVVPGTGNELFQPIHIEDLSQAILNLITQNLSAKTTLLNAVGPEKISLKDILLNLRKWLGFGKPVVVNIPKPITTFFVKLGDWLGTLVINSTLYKMLLINNVTTETKVMEFQDCIGFKPKNFQEGLRLQMSHVQDRWHARLYFLRFILRISIGFLWVFTALVSILFPETGYALLDQVGITTYPALWLYSAAILDGILGILTLLEIKIRWVGSLQILLMLIYTLIITLTLPTTWLHPFAPIIKNIPIMVATAIMIALESNR